MCKNSAKKGKLKIAILNHLDGPGGVVDVAHTATETYELESLSSVGSTFLTGFRLVVVFSVANQETAYLLTQFLTMTTTHKFPSLLPQRRAGPLVPRPVSESGHLNSWIYQD